MKRLTLLFLTLTVMLLFVPVVSATMTIDIDDFYTANPLASYNVLVSTEDNRSLPYNNADNLRAWYQFNEDNQSASDSSGNGNTGKLNGYSFNNANLNNASIISQGYFGYGANFTLNRSYVSLNQTVNYNNDSFTICAWIKPYFSGWQNASGNVSQIFGTYAGSSPETSFVVSWRNTTHYYLQVTTRNTSQSISTANSGLTYAFGNWNYACAVVNRSNGNQTIYVNSTFQASNAFAQNNITPAPSNTPRIGGTGLASPDTVRQFNGTIDSLNFWYRALSTAEMTSEANSLLPISGNNLSLSLQFESNFSQGTTNYTYDTNNLVAGQINGSFRFNGINTRVGTADIDLQTGTLSGWINTNSISGDNYMICKNDVSSYAGASYCLYTSGNKLRLLLQTGSVVAQENILQSTTTLSTGTWTHVSATFTSGNISLYINGVNAGCNYISGHYTCSNYSGTLNNNANLIYIGASSGSGFNWFNGSIDDVRIYNTSLNQTQITALYNAGAYRIYNYTSSNGNGSINLPLTNTGLVNMSLTTSANGGYYQSWAINHNTNLDYLNTMAQSTNTFSATQKVTGLTATASFVTQYLTNATHYMYVQPYLVNLSGGWYGQFNYTPTALATGSYAYTGAYNWLKNISASLIPEINGNAVTYTFRNGQYSFSEASTTSTSTGVGLVDTVKYNLTINATYPTGSVSIYIPNHNITNGIVIQ